MAQGSHNPSIITDRTFAQKKSRMIPAYFTGTNEYALQVIGRGNSLHVTCCLVCKTHTILLSP